MNKATERVIRKLIDQFEDELHRLLEDGYNPRVAVKKAYKKVPIMEAMRGTLVDELVAECARGYGVDVGVTGSANKNAIISGMPYYKPYQRPCRRRGLQTD